MHRRLRMGLASHLAEMLPLVEPVAGPAVAWAVLAEALALAIAGHPERLLVETPVLAIAGHSEQELKLVEHEHASLVDVPSAHRMVVVGALLVMPQVAAKPDGGHSSVQSSAHAVQLILGPYPEAGTKVLVGYVSLNQENHIHVGPAC